MAIIFPKEKKRQKFLFWILAISILATFLLLYFTFFTLPKETLLPEITVEKPKEVKINFEILRDPRLESLLPFEEISPLEEEIGRENPFIPY